MSAERIAVITGASLGIGYELARAYAARGFGLVLGARDAARLEAARRSIREEHANTRVELVAGDVTHRSVQDALIDAAGDHLSVLINNAGRGYYARFSEIEVDTLAELFALNVLGPVGLTQRALPVLQRTAGSVVMISSVAGVAAAPAMGAYAATKFALEAISSSLRAEVSRQGVHVLVVRPGPVATAFRDNAHSAAGERLQTPSGKDDRQPAAEVAEQIVRAVDARRSVLETSTYVHGASFLSRALPPLFRLVARRMADKKS